MSEKLDQLKEMCENDPLLDQLYMRIQYFNEEELAEFFVLLDCFLEKDNEAVQAQLNSINQSGSAALKSVVDFYISAKKAGQ